MALEREVLILQYSSGLRVLGEHNSNWTFIRYKSLDAAGFYLNSAETSVGIIDCSGVESPDTELERWLDGYKGMSWIVVLSKEQLSRKEWQLFIITHCYDYHTTPVSEERLLIVIGRAYGMANMKSNLSLSFQRSNIIGKHDKFKKSLLHLHHYSGGGLTLAGESGTGRRLLAETWAHSKGLRFLELTVNKNEMNDYIAKLDTLLQHYSHHAICVVISKVESLPQYVQHHICNLAGNKATEAKSCEFVFCCDLRADEVDDTDVFVPEFLMLLKKNWIEIPPLRDRGQDKIILARHYLYKLSREQENTLLGFSSEAEQAILKYDWPGNVTELIERISVGISSCEGGYLGAELMGLEEKFSPEECTHLSLRKARDDAEMLAIKRVLNLVSGRPGRAAELLCISRASLHRLIARYGIRR